MKTITLFVTATIAGSILATPALSSQRKTLYQVLFPKAYEQRQKRERERQLALKPVKPVKVKTSQYYTYKVTQRSRISIDPLKVELASVGSIGEGNTDSAAIAVEVASPSLMTSDLLAAEKTKFATETHLAKAISAYYSENQSYIWINESGDWNARARSVFKVLENAGSYGLESADYRFDVNVETDDPEKAPALQRISREIALTNAVLRYAMDAQFGVINPNRLSGYHDLPVHDAKAPDVLETLLSSRLPANVLRSMQPTSEKFEQLRAELAALAIEDDNVIELPEKVLIKPGKSHDALPLFVAAIRKRASSDLLDAHKEFLDSYDGSTEYSKEAVALVKGYQKQAGLSSDGIIGPNTSRKIAGLNSEVKKEQVILAMERLRWLPEDLGRRHVFINQPEYRARYIESGKEKLSMRVVVGKRSNQTNFFYDEIEQVVYNPYWGVPRSIIVNEFLPKSLENPGYLDQSGYEITNTRGKRISASSIQWNTVGVHPNFNVRQPPGSKNALGNVKILFPNKHSIYMHDTPSKHLFKKENRAFSHGCIRLHDPQGMAAAVLGKTKDYVKSNISTGKNQKENLKVKVPVYVSYFTAWPQKDGSVSYFRDMYGRDAHLMKAFKATRKARSTSISS